MKKEQGRREKKPPAPPAPPSGPPSASPWKNAWLFATGLLVATMVAYLPVWHAGFLTDDGTLLLKNGLVQEGDGWWRVWVNRAVDYVPATSTTFWLEWRLWAAKPLGYHIDNVLLHALAAILIWQILARLRVAGARLAAAIFALHPVNVASVAWIAERKNTLAMVFFAIALLAYVVFEDTGRTRWYWAAAVAFVLAIFSKTAVAPLPLVLLGMAWWRRGRIRWTDLRRSMLFFGLAVGAGALGIWIQHSVSHSIAVRHESWSGRLAGAGWVVWFYLGKCLWPIHLIFLYPRWHIDPSNVIFYAPTVLVIGVLVIGWIFRAGWGKALLFGFGYFVALLLPVMGLVDLSLMGATLVADHWQYFAIIGPIALVSAALVSLSAGIKTIPRAALCAILLTTLGWLSWRQCGVYDNSYSFWKATVDRNPGSFLAQGGLGNALFHQGGVDEAIACYNRALELEPTFFDGRYDLGNIYLQSGRPAEAAAQFQAALQIRPDDALALNNLAWICATCPEDALRNGPKAIELAKRADQVSAGRDIAILGTLAAGYAEAGQFADAISTIQRALKVSSKQSGSTKDLEQQLESYRRGAPTRDSTQMIPLAKPAGGL